MSNSPTETVGVLEPRRIVVRGVNWIGDAVMTIPALQRLRERFPRAHIALLTPEKFSGLWAWHPAVDQIISIPANTTLWATARRLKQFSFDLALLFPNSPRAALEVWLAGVPRRIGYARPWRNWWLTQAISPRPGRVEMRKRSLREIQKLSQSGAPVEPALPASAHQMFEYLHLLGVAVGASPEPTAPRLCVQKSEIDSALEKFDAKGELKAPTLVLGLVPGAEYGAAKRWPVDRFIQTSLEVSKQTGCHWLILGGGKDQVIGAQIAAALAEEKAGVSNLAGRTSIRELCALLKLCRAVLANDTGPMHIAAGVGTPVIVPFGSTSPALTAPGLPQSADHYVLQHRVPCSPCFLRECPIDFRCMMGIEVGTVRDAVLAAVRKHKPML